MQPLNRLIQHTPLDDPEPQRQYEVHHGSRSMRRQRCHNLPDLDRIDIARRLCDRVRMPLLAYLVLGFVPLAMKETILAWQWHQRGSRLGE